MICSAQPLSALLLLTFVSAAVPLFAESTLYYAVDDDGLVITNVMDRKDLQRVPGTAPRRGAAVENDLPATPYDTYIAHVAAENGLSPTLLKSVAMVESGLDPRAVSPKGAQGLMQLMPATAKQYGVRDAFNPLENLRAGARHLSHLLEEFDGNLNLALAAYNAGAGAVRKYQGIPAYKETRNYVRKVNETMGRRPRHAPPAAPRYEAVQLVRSADGTLTLSN